MATLSIFQAIYFVCLILIYRTIEALAQLAAFGCNIVLTSRLISSVTSFTANFPMQLWRIEGMSDALLSAYFQLRNVDAQASSLCRYDVALNLKDVLMF